MQQIDLLGSRNELWREFLPAGRIIVGCRADMGLDRANRDEHAAKSSAMRGRTSRRHGSNSGGRRGARWRVAEAYVARRPSVVDPELRAVAATDPNCGNER